jgi:hypothetical protein
VDGSVLQNWVILPSTSLPAGMRVEDEWIITQKAPVDATRDQRFVMGLKTMQLGRGGTNDWVRNE